MVWPVRVASLAMEGYFHTMIWFWEYLWGGAQERSGEGERGEGGCSMTPRDLATQTHDLTPRATRGATAATGT